MYSKITNPLTGRKVSILTKKGSVILQNFINQSGGEVKRDGWIGNVDNPLNECDSIVNTNWWGKQGGKHPIQIGDEYKIIFGRPFVNYNKKKRRKRDKLLRMIGAEDMHAWLEVTSSKTKCKYTFGLGGDGGGILNPGHSRVMINSPDLIIRKCRRRAKECIDAHLQGDDYEIDGVERGVININSDEEGGCKYVCSGITSINSHDDEFNKYYPNFMEVKRGEIRHVHLRIIDWLMDNSTSMFPLALEYFEDVVSMLTDNKEHFSDLNIDLNSLWDTKSPGRKIFDKIYIELKHKLDFIGTERKLRKRFLREFMNNYDIITDVNSTSVTTVIPFKYLISANVLGLSNIADFKAWLNDRDDALANCQSFASDFHSNPTYIFNKLYPNVYDQQVENEKTNLEKRIAKLRWTNLKNKLTTAVEIQKQENKLESQEAAVKPRSKFKMLKQNKNKNIHKKPKQIDIKHLDDAVYHTRVGKLLEEHDVLNSIL